VIGIGVKMLRTRLSGLGVDKAYRTLRRDNMSFDSSDALAVANSSGIIRVRPIHPDLDVSVGAANLFELLNDLRDACRAHLDVGSEVIWGGKKTKILAINRESGTAMLNVEEKRQSAALCNIMPLIEGKI
jgi:hypothetical protein